MARQYQSPLQSTTTSSTTRRILNRESIQALSRDWKLVCSASSSKQDSNHLAASDGFPPLERCWSLSGETSTSSSSTTPSSEVEDASAKRIRAKYFYALGIAGKPQIPSTSTAHVPNVQPRIRSILKISQSTFSQNHAHPDNNTRGLGQANPSSSKGLFSSIHTHSRIHRRESKVVFKKDVSIHLIPNRHQFSSKEKEQLWMMPQELEETAYRNYIEFSLEQWDWQQAIEENDFVLVQGILTHPAHLVMMQQQMQCTANRQFCRIFSVQQHYLRQQHHQKPHPYPPSHHRYSSSRLSTNFR